MARTARLVVPNLAHHVMHRAYNREPIFLGGSDYAHYLANAEEARRSCDCKIYAFCLMLNHVHLLVNPGPDPGNLARFMGHIAMRQAHYRKKCEHVLGPVWEGRYRSSPVERSFLLPCIRYIELNPVRTFLADRPEEYPWSSTRSRLGRGPIEVDLDGSYLSLGNTPEERSGSYQRYLNAPIPYEEWNLIHRAVHSSDVTGSEQFKASLTLYFGRSVRRRKRGRPKRSVASTDSAEI